MGFQTNNNRKESLCNKWCENRNKEDLDKKFWDNNMKECHMPVNKKAINDKGQTKTSIKENLDKSKCGNNMNDKWGINMKEYVKRKMKERLDRKYS